MPDPTSSLTTPVNLTSVNIRPGVTILSVLRHLNYRPWYAIAEFVDNSLQSYLDHRADLERVDGVGFKLRVGIELSAADSGRLVVRDNAAGIHGEDYTRAFRPAEMPPNRAGMAEFGMGMKSAACWFAKRWMVRTSALGEAVTRTVHFDIEKIVHDRMEELTVRSDTAPEDAHFTEITLEGLHRTPQAKTVAKIKQHLCSIYRVFLRNGVLELSFDGDPLRYQEVRTLRAAHYKDPTGNPIEWRKRLDFDFGGNLRATGFAALRETASTSEAGFALFRRDRLIVGSADEGYRPEAIFGKSNSYRYQRVFGELHLDGFEVTHTKDGFHWDENEDVFLEFLREELDKPPLPLLQQAEEYRVRPKPADLKPAAELATRRTAEVIEREVPPILGQQMGAVPDEKAPPPGLPAAAAAEAKREIAVEIRDERWLITIELSADPAVGPWLELGDDKHGVDGVRRLGLRLSLAHPFMERFGGADPDRIEPLLRVAVGLALAETSARASGVRSAGTIRRNLNEFLRDALSKP
jgi:hypothetical protein